MRALTARLASISRRLHVALLAKPLPPQIAVYLHDIAEDMWPAFRAMLELFQQAGYRFIDPDEFPSAQDRVAFLSFDDNYRSFWRALPVLASLGVGATFYLNTGVFRYRADRSGIDAYFDRLRFHGGRVPLSVAELREIAAAGHVIGAHGHTHRMLAGLPACEARAEITTSKRLLEDLLGQEVAHFSYPFGMRRHFTENLRAFCRRIGFRTIANAIPGMQFAPRHPDRIQRSPWLLEAPLSFNLDNLRVHGRVFTLLTGRSPVG